MFSRFWVIFGEKMDYLIAECLLKVILNSYLNGMNFNTDHYVMANVGSLYQSDQPY